MTTLALIGNLDTTELIVVVVAAVLVFGRRLPQVAAQAGAQIGKLRRQLDTAWKDSGVDKEVREVQRSIESIRDAVPRDLSAGAIARTAANEFQRRVEVNQQREETAASTASAAEAANAPSSTTPASSASTPSPSTTAPTSSAGSTPGSIAAEPDSAAVGGPFVVERRGPPFPIPSPAEPAAEPALRDPLTLPRRPPEGVEARRAPGDPESGGGERA
ncbi:MAG: hypothetical protein U1F29_14515 [Planctomycetota bacterium]